MTKLIDADNMAAVFILDPCIGIVVTGGFDSEG